MKSMASTSYLTLTYVQQWRPGPYMYWYMAKLPCIHVAHHQRSKHGSFTVICYKFLSIEKSRYQNFT